MKENKEPVLIWQGNEITRAKYNYTALEINLMTMIFEEINKNGKSDYVTYSINLADFFRLSGLSDNNLFHVKKAVRELQSKFFEFHQTDNSWYRVPLISGVRINPNDNRIYVNIDPFIKPMLVECGKNTTRYYRESIFSIPGKNSKRIYHYCAMFRNTGICRIGLDEFKYKLELENSYGDSISMFKKKVLDIAILEINSHSDLQVSYELRKNAHKFRELIFFIKGKQTIDFANEKQYDTLRKMGLAAWQCDNAYKVLSREQIGQVIHQVKTGKAIQNVSAYTWNIFTKMGVPTKQI